MNINSSNLLQMRLRFLCFLVIIVQIVVLWVVTPCNVLSRYASLKVCMHGVTTQKTSLK
jgi:hypothetical protein